MNWILMLLSCMWHWTIPSVYGNKKEIIKKDLGLFLRAKEKFGFFYNLVFFAGNVHDNSWWEAHNTWHPWIDTESWYDCKFD